MTQINNEREQEFYERAEKELKLKLVEFSEKQEIQGQTAEAFYIWKDDPDMIIEFTSEEDIDDHTFTRFMDWFMFDFKTFDHQKSVIQLFYENEGNNLSRHELKLLNDWMNCYQSFFELKGKEQNKCMLRDILTGKELVVIDKNASRNAEVSDILYARPLKTGNEYYFSGAISIYPHLFKQTIIDYFKYELEEYRKINNQPQSTEQFLRDWSYIISNHIEDVVKHPQFLTRDGEEFIISSASYTCNNEVEAAKRLSSIENVKEITDGESSFRAFLLDDLDKRYSANMELDNELLAIKCNSRKKLEIVKNIVENKLDDLIEHREDNFRELNSFMKNDQTVLIRKERMPSDNIDRDELHKELDRYYEGWINTPLDKLGGITPLQAMSSDNGKEKLEAVLKDLESIYEHARKVGEPYYDIRKLRDKLKDIANRDS